VHAKWGKRRLFGRSKCTSRNARLKLIRQYCHSLQRLLFSLQSLYGSSCGRLNGVELEMRYIDTITARHVSPTIAVHSSTEVHRYLESGQRRSEVRECCTRLLLPSMHALRDLTITPRPYSRCFHSREAHNDARATRTRSRGYEDNADMLSPLHSLANHWGRLRHFDQSVSHVVFLRPCPMPMLTHLTALSSAPSRYHLPPP
jgi:hypothetical protein